MFGERQRDHTDRYAYAEEWISAIKEMWGKKEAFDFQRQYLHMQNVVSDPKPFGGTAPLLMNAATSDVGRAFALRHCQGFFTTFRELDVQKSVSVVKSIKEEARTIGREIDVYTQGHVVCRQTRNEAEEYFRYFTTEGADFDAIDNILGLKGVTRENTPDYEERRMAAPRMNIGYPIVGSPDDVADKLARIHGAGISGIAFSLVNYVKELPLLAQEVLPRLERMGLRAPLRAESDHVSS